MKSVKVWTCSNFESLLSVVAELRAEVSLSACLVVFKREKAKRKSGNNCGGTQVVLPASNFNIFL